MTPQKANNITTKDLVDSEGEESPAAEFRRIMVRIFDEFTKHIQIQLNEYQENTEKAQEATETTK
jgi:hypothetical protein